MNLIILFCIITVVNVLLQTVKSLITVKGGWLASATINCIAYGFYTIVIIYTNCELSMWIKAAITAAANFIGVAIVKIAEEKIRKDRLWKVEVTIPIEQAEQLIEDCAYYDFSYGYQYVKDHMLVTFFCNTKEDSRNVRNLLRGYKAKYFVTEQNATL